MKLTYKEARDLICSLGFKECELEDNAFKYIIESDMPYSLRYYFEVIRRFGTRSHTFQAGDFFIILYEDNSLTGFNYYYPGVQGMGGATFNELEPMIKKYIMPCICGQRMNIC